jgi:hypothetical protein
MEDRVRAMPELGRRGTAEHLATTVPVLRRHGLPRMPCARRLGGVRFATEFVGGREPGRRLARA